MATVDDMVTLVESLTGGRKFMESEVRNDGDDSLVFGIGHDYERTLTPELQLVARIVGVSGRPYPTFLIEFRLEGELISSSLISESLAAGLKYAELTVDSFDGKSLEQVKGTFQMLGYSEILNFAANIVRSSR